MATFGGRAVRADTSDRQTKSNFTSPQKIRELLNEGVASDQSGSNSVQGDSNVIPSNGVVKSPCEANNKDAFFSRVGSYSCLKWAGKPRALSPLRCAKYGWINVDCDMLKCSTCQAFLCASIQPALDYQKYGERISEITRQLQTQHEKFCSWPDFPCPNRFWMIPVSESAVLLSAFLERFESALVLEQQLPAMKPQQLQVMSLTEDAISALLQLIEDEQKKLGGSLAISSPLRVTPEALAAQVAACIVALCGWAASPAQLAMNLPILTCTYCMRKVGMWNFHQMENAGGSEGDAPSIASSPPTTPRPGQEGAGEGLTHTSTSTPTPNLSSPSPSPTLSRMKLRSQDSLRSESVEGNPSPLAARTRSRDSPSPSEELPSTLGRGKRAAPRTRGQCEVPSSPLQKNKRPRLSSASSPEGPMNRNAFDPVGQHRDWCPWVSTNEEDVLPPKNGSLPEGCEAERPQPGWRAALTLFLSMKHSLTPVGASPSQGAQDKSKRVFTILRQWQSYST
ncbi:nuclear-interacting partner of ALK [Clupea harengus]|uniref:Nuclear-interacting partner of ALK n=1 Tax=Clupea harengus TaxID=7950 RepID=A0A6P3VSH4_CLUHA|nr:nuclear-interacting partner of ALK [Clupea harengus]